MLKVKRSVHSKKSTNQIDEWENDIKNSIKKMYIQNQKDNDLIKQYENALQKIKQEYTIIYKENQELKKTVQEIQSQKPSSTNENLRKRPLSRFDYENEYDENDDVQYIVRKKKKIPKKRIIYEEESDDDDDDDDDDEIDGENIGKAYLRNQ